MPLFHTTLTGIVQGVGFRPFVANLARRHGICGTVSNKGPYVEIYAQGPRPACKAFLDGVKNHPPARAIILTMHTDELDAPATYPDFQIIESAHERGPIYVSPDIATCDDCARELYDPENPRYLHPFINCTNCGPRLTIEESAPYDRCRTTMKNFPMCDRCEKEYHDPKNRRYDAQPVCCPHCGPHVYLLDSHASASRLPDHELSSAITNARRALISGRILALKGIGGFHLACDATNEAAVQRLRARKHRPSKPFALMAKDLATIDQIALIETDTQRQLLTGHQKPILLLKKKSISCVAPSVAPDATKLGLLLPYTPLHMLLFHYPDGLDDQMPKLLVMTSGNPSGAPICHTDQEALESLSGIADLILTHNRPIRLRADDTVLDWHKNHPYPIRRSRGFAPLPIYFEKLSPSSTEADAPYLCDHDRTDAVAERARKDSVKESSVESGEPSLPPPSPAPTFASSDPQSLAIGAELKNTFTLARGPLLYPSPYIGDTTDLRTVLALEDSADLLSRLLDIRPQLIACDLHPRYNTTALAEKLAKDLRVPLLKIQHHHAHILSCLAEHGETGPALGLALDGTGYGPDSTVWGGELLLATPASYTRLATIDPFLQAGGDKAPREPWRIALALLQKAFPSGEGARRAERVSEVRPNAPHDTDLRSIAVDLLHLCTAQEYAAQTFLLGRHLNTITSTSCGRLFDAVSALLGLCTHATCEGEAPMRLEALAETWADQHPAEAAAILQKAFPSGEDARKAERVSEVRPDTTHESNLRSVHTPFRIPTTALFAQIARQRIAALSASPSKGSALDFPTPPASPFGGGGPEGAGEGSALPTTTTPAATTGELAYTFHAHLARLLADACDRARTQTGLNTIALSGGVFQNPLLLSLTEQHLTARHFRILTHHQVPPNAGGLSLGQSLAAQWHLTHPQHK